ncbi:cytochrome c family protein [Flavobacterium sp. M31R6]|uniref:c-type cytochrome n=1 Tax=Flavobacterium sp. M31R6 TaxID=2739062 RepID=UPI00156A7355|nr:c-type cytochrome [Flavobacterium sp. M31R6]QKJ64327.1 c-type cytochrome [Flavobacterium sp. M31R6]
MKTVKIKFFISCLFIFFLISCNKQKEQKTETIVNVQPETELDLLALKEKSKLGKDTVITVINDPVYHKTKKYHAVNALLLLKNEIDLSKVDIKNTSIIFECIDGYKPEMPLELFLKTNPFLAFKDVDAPKGSNWEKIVKNGNEMNADPFYLVYTSTSTDNQEYKWPYNVIKFRLESKNKNVEALQPKDDEVAMKGFALFQKHCITCHAINGIGGEMGPELNYPKSVTEYWKENELVDYIVDPASFRHKVKMPTLGITKQESQEIVKYLKYMSGKKIEVRK